MKKLTVFTPTFNRAYLLPRLYESLCMQTNKDFIWLIIDDGSTDGTAELVEKWKRENKVEIDYYWKENGGMHTAHNLAYQKITTELNVCIDSDDWMPLNAVELILLKWGSIELKDEFAGIVGLDAFENGIIIGTEIPERLNRGNLIDLYNKHKVKGDKKVILRTDLVGKYPKYPEFENERLVPLGILYLLVGKDFDFSYSNDVYCIVEYQQTGSSESILKQYKQSPRGFAYARKIYINNYDSFTGKFKEYIHLVSSLLFSGNIGQSITGLNFLILILAFPFGLGLNLYIRMKLFLS